MPTQAALKALFTSFDTDSSGFVDVTELQAALAKGGKRVSLEDTEALLAQVDTNSDGQVSFEEFEEIFKLAPNMLPPGLSQLVDVSNLLIGGMGDVVNAGVGLGVTGVKMGVGVTSAGLSAAGSLTARGVGSMTELGSGAMSMLGITEKAFDIKDTNVAMIGSDEDKAARKAAAETEGAWAGVVGSSVVGIKVWRIEKFEVVPWPEDKYGSFYEGDSYIVLHTYKEVRTLPPPPLLSLIDTPPHTHTHPLLSLAGHLRSKDRLRRLLLVGF